MSSFGSVSLLIAQARDGDEDAFGALHSRYWPAIVAAARRRLGSAPIRAADEEDVAQTAFLGFYRSVKSGGVPRLENRHQLLALLTHIVACKAVNEIKHSLAQRRGGGRGHCSELLSALVEERSHSPLEKVILNDCFQFYMAVLPDGLREVAELHLAGLSNREIAEHIGCVERTVERKLALLRNRWQSLSDDSLDRNVGEMLAR